MCMEDPELAEWQIRLDEFVRAALGQREDYDGFVYWAQLTRSQDTVSQGIFYKTYVFCKMIYF